MILRVYKQIISNLVLSKNRILLRVLVELLSNYIEKTDKSNLNSNQNLTWNSVFENETITLKQSTRILKRRLEKTY